MAASVARSSALAASWYGTRHLRRKPSPYWVLSGVIWAALAMRVMEVPA